MVETQYRSFFSFLLHLTQSGLPYKRRKRRRRGKEKEEKEEVGNYAVLFLFMHVLHQPVTISNVISSLTKSKHPYIFYISRRNLFQEY